MMLVVNVILFTVLLFVAIVILHKLINSKNGTLRKIMIGYFSAEVFALIGLIALETFNPVLPQTQVTFFVIFLPKGVVKVIFFFYLNKH